MGGPGILGSDVSGASRRKSKLITIGAGLTLSGGALVNTLDLTPYALLPDTLPAVGTLLSYGGSRQLAAGGTVTHSGALNIGANALTCGAITASGNLALRNGLTAMTAELFETYTSATNYGSLCLKATASGHQIGSARGTSGSNRAVQLGHFDASGVFTAGITVATTGLTTIYTPSDVAFGLTLDSASMGFFYMRPTWDGNGVWRFGPSTNAYRTRFNGMTEFRVESGASRTITEDQHITFEMTSDTAGNLVYRGSDGTTRRMGMDFDTTAVNYLPLSGGTLTGALSLGANALTCGAITASGKFDSNPLGTYFGRAEFTGAGNGYPNMTLTAYGHQFEFYLDGPGSGDVYARCTSAFRVTDSGNQPQRFFCGPLQETPTQSALDPTTSDIPTGKRMGWYNSTTGEFRDWVNIGGTLKKSAAYT